jgi:small nuclear ribonucleoprotein E
MNLVIDDAVEVKQITKTNKEESRRPLGMSGMLLLEMPLELTFATIGQILLKGDNVSLIQSLSN